MLYYAFMTNPEDSFGGLEHSIRKRREYVEDLEHKADECRTEERKHCLEAVATFAGSAASFSMLAYDQLEWHQLEHIPPEKLPAACALLGLGLAVHGGRKFIRGVTFGNIGVRLRNSAEATKRTIAELERFVD